MGSKVLVNKLIFDIFHNYLLNICNYFNKRSSHDASLGIRRKSGLFLVNDLRTPHLPHPQKEPTITFIERTFQNI